MVYDTGHWNHDPAVFKEFQDFIGDADIDLLITSHSDSDHIAATDELFNEYRVHRVIRTGMERDTRTWEDHRDAIVAAAGNGLTHDGYLNCIPVLCLEYCASDLGFLSRCFHVACADDAVTIVDQVDIGHTRPRR